ncbi:MAG: aminoglycoside phosphotransferase [Thermoleophilia bacterium]|nr:aminoglycoside phosphotransferase [Thermoleophilia bacterium]
MAEWRPDIILDEPAVRELVLQSAPGLLEGGATLREIARGWDNVVWRIKSDGAPGMLARVPVREIGVPGVQRELWLLERVAQHATLPVPGPITVLEPTDRARWRGFTYPELVGTEALLTPLDGDAQLALATQLGGFLRRLHDPATLADVDPRGDLPVDPNMRADMAFRVPRTHEALDDLGDDVLPAEARERAAELLAAAADLPADEDQVFLHGDLHPRHLLLDPASGDIVGVIDWGDACRGSRSIDLALYWCLLDGPARSAFRAAYGDLSRSTLLRARVLAMFLTTMLLVSAPSFDLPGLEDACRRALLRTLDALD